MKYKAFIFKNFFAIRMILIAIGTLVMFYALFFSDKTMSVNTITENINNPIMYLCLFISFLGSYWISYPYRYKKVFPKNKEDN